MELKDPIAAYIAESNVEAAQIAHFLTSGGVQAHTEEDTSVVSLYTFGIINQIHKPKVWISRNDTDTAQALLKKYEAERTVTKPYAKSTANANTKSDADLQVSCEDCGHESTFAAELNGTLQRCPKCHGYVDVGEFDWPEMDEFCDDED